MPLPRIIGGDWVKAECVGELPDDYDILMAVEPEAWGTRRGVRKIMACFFEPEGVRISNHHILTNRNIYDCVLTCDQELLAKLPQAVNFPFGSCWISPEDQTRLASRSKTFGVSFVCGGKDYMPGHRVRREIWSRQREVPELRRWFFRSAVSTPPGFADAPQLASNAEGKAVLFGVTHHLAIENCQQPGYFTEKLIDCFRTKTVPLYWGCPDIGRWFDLGGMIAVHSAEDALDRMRRLTPDDYGKRLEVIDENFHRAAEFARDTGERMGEVLRKYLCLSPSIS